MRKMTLSQLSAAIADRSISPVEATQAALEAIETTDGELGAFLSVYPEAALDAAKAAETEIRKSGLRSPLHGVPIAVKDIFEVGGMVRTCGSIVHGRETCDRDATLIARLRDAGAVIVGLTRLNEYAYGPTGINAVTGSPKNPHNREHACGGSSSGSGCAVAGDLVWGAIGTDTGGSVRIPAANCGITGLKPTTGWVSRHGIYPLCASFDTAGPMAQSPRDCGLLMAAMAGPDRNDPMTWNAPAYPKRATAPEIPALRVGVPRSLLFDDLHEDIAINVEAALQRLAAAGAAVTDIDIPDGAGVIPNWNTMAMAEAYATHRQHLTDHRDQLSPDVAVRLEAGAPITAPDYLAARDGQSRFKASMARLMDDFDVLIAPTTPIPAVRLDTGTIEVDGVEIQGAPVMGRLTRLANFTGQPALSIPCGTTAAGLPVGLQLIGTWYDDARLVEIAERIGSTIAA